MKIDWIRKTILKITLNEYEILHDIKLHTTSWKGSEALMCDFPFPLNWKCLSKECLLLKGVKLKDVCLWREAGRGLLGFSYTNTAHMLPIRAKDPKLCTNKQF